MPIETNDAITWALLQLPENEHELVDKVREYFNTNVVVYLTFSYNDLVPYL